MNNPNQISENDEDSTEIYDDHNYYDEPEDNHENSHNSEDEEDDDNNLNEPENDDQDENDDYCNIIGFNYWCSPLLLILTWLLRLLDLDPYLTYLSSLAFAVLLPLH